MTKHTPGPWTIYEGPNRRFSIVSGSLEIAHIGADAPNASLIAAAPDLLEALRAAVNACHYISTLETAPKATRDLAYKHMQAANAAIAKATGDNVS